MRGQLLLLRIFLEQGHVSYRVGVRSGIKRRLASITDTLNQRRTAVGVIAVGSICVTATRDKYGRNQRQQQSCYNDSSFGSHSDSVNLVRLGESSPTTSFDQRRCV